tara:strand:+ start:51 stop:221 length:171 start_codon:yes stop_codon:yes gene_type:complete
MNLEKILLKDPMLQELINFAKEFFGDLRELWESRNITDEDNYGRNEWNKRRYHDNP